MAVNIDESSRIFTFVIVSDKPKISKNTKITEKPSKDKDNNMSTTDSSPPPTVTNNEQSINGINEKKQNSQETESKQQSVQSIPEVKVNNEPNDDKNLTNETKEQTNVEEISTRDVKNNLSIVPPKNTPPQFVSSPSDLTENKIPERPPVSPSKSTGGLFKKFGKIIKNGKESKTEDTITSEQQQITKSEPIPEEAIPAANSNIANVENVENVEKAEDTSIKTDENQKEDNKKDTSELAKPTRMSSITNMKLFITRTSSSIVEKLKEEFDNLDKKIYPDIEESQREQLMENRDTVSSPKSSEVTNDASQKIQSTQNIMANNLVDLDERGERLEDVGQKTENLKNSASEFARLAAELSKQNEKKSKGWKLW